eukprot:TRINITY_DN27425_c0_g1_i1.p1 TRINITY_DN27425_c0_g1~~TRINITY_DN27425_c0_g1_i1.p1  ORF type:complete len:231 (+),score=48.98 TRINITY_DN27425_c0_g1_i1:78-695(+)
MDHYKVLGVARSATPDDIKAAYRSLARELHPDKNKEEGAEDRFKTLAIAYEILGSPRKKRNYDLLLGEWGKGPTFNGNRRNGAAPAGPPEGYTPPTECVPSDASFNRSLSHDAYTELQQARAVRAEKLKRARDLKSYAVPDPVLKKPVKAVAKKDVKRRPPVPEKDDKGKDPHDRRQPSLSASAKEKKNKAGCHNGCGWRQQRSK